MKFKWAGALFLLVFVLLIILIANNPFDYKKTGTAMDTMYNITAHGLNAERAVTKGIDKITEVENRMSATILDSDIYKLNNGGQTWGNHDTIRVINRSRYFSWLSGGIFDATIKPIVDLYANDSNPKAADIALARAKVDYKKLVENQPLSNGMQLDLGAIAKGYAVDEVALILRQEAMTNYIIDIGGNVSVYGKKYKVGIRDPFGDADDTFATITASNANIATSGKYERGEHIYDTKTGLPIDNNVASATVMAGSAMDADAMSTILYIMGENGLKLVEQQNAKGILVLDDGTVVLTSNMKPEEIKISNNKFKLR